MTTASIEPVKVEFLGYIDDPLQMQHIKDTRALRSLVLSSFIPAEIYDRNIPCISVTKLSVETGIGDIVYIDWLLSEFPSLEELSISGGPELRFMENRDNTPFYCSMTCQNMTKLYKYNPSAQNLESINNRLHIDADEESTGVHIITSTEKNLRFNGCSISLSYDQIAVVL